ncbi:MAG: phosphopentomutase/phosphoglucosamine mutase [Methanocorpusculaceae archaeon]|nr:phosphopentomutase/phosphoglucosamine mutase [Methanocorpusculaceae archaeon]
MLFGSSGIRKLFAQELLSLGPLVGAAVASNAKRVVLATDSRTSRNTLSDVILSGLISGGAEVLFGGIAPTPSVALAAGKADAGVMITASHNPENYNGYKLFRPDGSSYTVAQQEEIERRIAEPVYAAWDKQGFVSSVDIRTPHKEKIIAEISVPENMTVVVDCGNGAGGQITPDVIGADGAKVIPVNCDSSGKFARPSEPLEKNLLHIPELIRKTGASCAVVHDGDADRMMAFDNRGRYVDGDQLLALFAKYLDAKQVVTTVDASMAIEEVAEVHRTPVGDSFVSEELLSWGTFGGEPSGSWIFPKHSLCPDGPYAAALFAEISSEWNVAEELDALPKYTILRDAVMTPHGKEIMGVLGAENPTDGIRVTEENGWYLIRASGTEPKVRCTAEGRTKEDAKRMLEAGMSALKKAEKEVQ